MTTRGHRFNQNSSRSSRRVDHALPVATVAVSQTIRDPGATVRGLGPEQDAVAREQVAPVVSCKPDVLFRPAEVGQVECEERAEAQLNIGEKKIRPIESPPAAIGYFAIAKLAPVALLREDAPRSGM